MRRAVIVVGSHGAGKSKTINKYLKPKLRLRERQHKFLLAGEGGTVLSQSREEAAGQQGLIMSQSPEEAGKGELIAALVRKYSRFNFLVLAARPSTDPISCLRQLRARLRDAAYAVSVIDIAPGQSERYYKERAGAVLGQLVKR
jgi:hypothetical protein